MKYYVLNFADSSKGGKSYRKKELSLYGGKCEEFSQCISSCPIFSKKKLLLHVTGRLNKSLTNDCSRVTMLSLNNRALIAGRQHMGGGRGGGGSVGEDGGGGGGAQVIPLQSNGVALLGTVSNKLLGDLKRIDRTTTLATTMAQMAHFSFPYYFTIPNSEFRIPKFVEQTKRLLLLFFSILQTFE